MARSALTPTLNFLRKRRHKLAYLRKQDRILFFVALSVFTVSVLVALLMAGYMLSLRRRLDVVSRTDTQTSRMLTDLVEVEAQYLIFSNRLGILAELWPERGSQQQTLQFLTNITLPRLAYQQVSYDQKSHRLEFSVVADDFFALEKFIATMKSPEIQTQMESFQVGSVQRNDEGKYSFTVEMRLGVQS